MAKQIHGGDVYRNPDVLDFSSNVNPLGPPANVLKAAADSLKNIEHYPDVMNTSLISALSKCEQVPEEYIVLGNGAAEVIFSYVRAVKPKKALLPAPTFAEYGLALSSADCDVITYPMKDLMVGDDILEFLDKGVDVVFLCNPNNPTGFLIEPELLRKTAAVCQEKGIYLMLDECFLDFADKGKEHSLKSMLKEWDRLFILRSFTKLYAMAGLRLGYGLCANPDLLGKMEAVCQPWNISIPAQAAGEAALKEEAYVKEALDIVKAQRKYLKEEMKKTGLKVYDSKANYIFFEGPEDLYERCLKRGVLIRDCSNYPGLKEGCFRVAVRRKQENDRLLEVLRQCMAEENK